MNASPQSAASSRQFFNAVFSRYGQEHAGEKAAGLAFVHERQSIIRDCHELGQTQFFRDQAGRYAAFVAWIIVDDVESIGSIPTADLLRCNRGDGAHLVVVELLCLEESWHTRVLEEFPRHRFPKFLSAWLWTPDAAEDTPIPLWQWSDVKAHVAALIREGLEGEPTPTCVCLVRFTDALDDVIALRIGDGRVEEVVAPDATADAELVIDSGTLLEMLRKQRTIDVRELVSGPLSCSRGDRNMIAMVAHAFLRPPEQIATLFEAAERRWAICPREEPVRRLSSAGREQVLDHLERFLPVVVEGYGAHCPAVGWPPQRIFEHFADVQITALLSELSFRLQDFPRIVLEQTGRTVYSRGVRLPDPMRSIFPPPFFDVNELRPPLLWFGVGASDKEAVTPLHRDIRHALLCHVQGRKRLVLYSPDQRANLYPRQAFNQHQACWVRQDAPDYVRFPTFRQARSVEVVLEPGDILVIPAGWFHCAYCEEGVNLSVTYFLRHPWD